MPWSPSLGGVHGRAEHPDTHVANGVNLGVGQQQTQRDVGAVNGTH